ncbi:MAG: sigma-70 family RNA polymerase sigma factor [Candidatus Eisenbacteria bacterium]
MTERDPDRACMDRLRAGDTGALEELYDRHTPLLYSLVLRIVRRATDAEDVIQETWLQAWRNAGAFDAARGSVAGWLITIARSRAIDRFRSLASRLNAETKVEPGVGLTPDEPGNFAEAGQLRARVSAALGALPDTQRQTLELAYFGGLSQSEIAARLGAPLGTVKSWCRQGLLRLRELVPQEEWT